MVNGKVELKSSQKKKRFFRLKQSIHTVIFSAWCKEDEQNAKMISLIVVCSLLKKKIICRFMVLNVDSLEAHSVLNCEKFFCYF